MIINSKLKIQISFSSIFAIRMTDKEKFISLTQVQKLLLIMESGHLFLEKKEEDRLMKLYIYKKFYVEIIYDSKSNKVLSINTPEAEYIVDEYMDVLTVDDLLNL